MGKSEIEALMKAGGIPMEDMALFATLGDINDPLWKSNSDPTTQYDAYCGGKQPQQTANSVVYQQQQQAAAATSQQQQQRQQQQSYSHQQSYTQSYQKSSSSSTTAIYHQQYRQQPQQGQSTPNMSSHHMYSNSVPRNGAYSSTPKVGQSQQSWQQAMGQGNENVKVKANGSGNTALAVMSSSK